MSNTNTEVLTTAYEKLQGALTQANTVLPPLQEAIEKGNLDNYATTSDLEEKANKVDLQTQKARIDNFTTLAEGSTTGDAELIDGRVGADGITYSNIGGAIRNQIGNINNSIDNYINPCIEEYIAINICNNSLLTDGKYCWRESKGGKLHSDGDSTDYLSIVYEVNGGEIITVNSCCKNAFCFVGDSDRNDLGNLDEIGVNIINLNNKWFKLPNSAKYLYLSIYKNTSEGYIENGLIVTKGKLLNIADYTATTFPYGSIAFSDIYKLDKNIKELETSTDLMFAKNLITDDCIKENYYVWPVVGNTVEYTSNNSYISVTFPVLPNTEYSINHAFTQTGFGALLDKNKKVLDKLTNYTDNNFITPSNCYYIACSWHNSKSTVDDLVVLQGSYNNVISYNITDYPRGENARNVYTKDELSDVFENIKTNYIYVATTGSDTSGDGSKLNPYATVYHANETISNNTYYNRYEIIIVDGTYTDLQEKYAGVAGTNYQGIMGKSYVTYRSKSNDPTKCIFEWNGGTGFDSVTDANTTYKCFFHINNDTNETYVKGIKFTGKNLRYCLHFESNKNSIPAFENCIFDWNGADFIHNKPVVGMGGSLFSKVTFRKCKFLNSESTAGIQWHDNEYDGTYTLEQGAKLRFEDCYFDNLNIQVRSGNYNRTMPFSLELIRCGGINIVYPTLYAGGTKNYWRSTIQSCLITDDRISNCDNNTTYNELTESK